MRTRILFVGQGLFCESLTRLLSENAVVEIIGAARTCGEAREILENQQPEVLIVDHAQVALRGGDLEELLQNGPDTLKVIYLTLSENKMVIHNRQKVSNVTHHDLVNALQIPALEDSAP